MASQQPFLIVGGGLGGLTTALALAQHGIASRVLEGAPAFGAVGYGIQFGPNVFHVFDRLGVTAEVLKRADAPPAVLMLDAFTGAEVTRNAVVSSPEHKLKVSLRSPSMLPKVALVDPELTYNLPPAITAATGMDAR